MVSLNHTQQCRNNNFVNFLQNPHNRHPIARPVVCVQNFINMYHASNNIVVFSIMLWLNSFMRPADCAPTHTHIEQGAVITRSNIKSWWRHQMETFSALLAICAGNSPVTGEFPAQRPVTRSIDVFFDLRLNKRLSKQSWGWWFNMLSCPIWRHCNSDVAHNTVVTEAEHKSHFVLTKHTPYLALTGDLWGVL